MDSVWDTVTGAAARGLGGSDSTLRRVLDRRVDCPGVGKEMVSKEEVAVTALVQERTRCLCRLMHLGTNVLDGVVQGGTVTIDVIRIAMKPP